MVGWGKGEGTEESRHGGLDEGWFLATRIDGGRNRDFDNTQILRFGLAYLFSVPT